jgi:C4-dicarboxylate-specific signal transduction histidine kinase
LLADLIREVQDLIVAKTKNNDVDMVFEAPDNVDEILLHGDDIQVEQVLINLINNSIDEHVENPDGWVKFVYEEDSEQHHLIVTDAGEGIPVIVQQKLFDPFFTTKVAGKGTGLGLSISKGIMQDHGGDLEYRLYKGYTAFVIKLPKKLKNKAVA